MRNKRVLLATTAMAILAGAGQAQAGDLYISVFGGANFFADQSVVLDPTGDTEAFSSDADTGFVLGGAIGTHLDKWAKGLRVELEASYRRNDIGGSWTTDGIGNGGAGGEGGFIDGNMSTFAIMANTWYDIDIGSKYRPYVGGGVGWARTHGDVQFIETVVNSAPVSSNSVGTEEDSNSGFVWQLGVGLNYEVMPDVDVGIDYRYIVGPRFDEFLTFNSNGNLENENHAVAAHITIGIDAD
jgi:opacity protein-like surface antigen